MGRIRGLLSKSVCIGEDLGVLPRVGTVTLNPGIDQYYLLQQPLCRGDLNRAQSMATYIGGKGINVSLTLNKLGVSSLIVACVGGRTGDLLVEKLQRFPLPQSLIRIAEENRRNIKLIEAGSGLVTEVNAPGPHLSRVELEQIKGEILRKGREMEYLVLTGSLPRGTPPSFYADLLQALSPGQTRVILDADGARLKLGVKSKPFLVKPNQREMEEFLGQRLVSKEDFIRAAQVLLDLGVRFVVITREEEGALFAYRDELYWAAPPGIQVGSAVGGGDALLAGVIFGLLREMALEEIARLATATAVATVSRKGTDFPEMAEVQEFIPEIRLTRLNHL